MGERFKEGAKGFVRPALRFLLSATTGATICAALGAALAYYTGTSLINGLFIGALLGLCVGALAEISVTSRSERASWKYGDPTGRGDSWNIYDRGRRD